MSKRTKSATKAPPPAPEVPTDLLDEVTVLAATVARGVAQRLRATTANSPGSIAKLGQLSSAIQCPLDTETLYLRMNLDVGALPAASKLKPVVRIAAPASSQSGYGHVGVATAAIVSSGHLEQLQNAPPIMSTAQLKRGAHKQRQKENTESAGSKWFDLPATEVTPEVEQNLKLLKLRNVLDPKRHYRASDSKKAPKFFQIATVIDGPSDYYAKEDGRRVRNRKRTLVDELMSDADFQRYNKGKFQALQQERMRVGRGPGAKKRKTHHK